MHLDEVRTRQNSIHSKGAANSRPHSRAPFARLESSVRMIPAILLQWSQCMTQVT